MHRETIGNLLKANILINCSQEENIAKKKEAQEKYFKEVLSGIFSVETRKC